MKTERPEDGDEASDSDPSLGFLSCRVYFGSELCSGCNIRALIITYTSVGGFLIIVIVYWAPRPQANYEGIKAPASEIRLCEVEQGIRLGFGNFQP